MSESTFIGLFNNAVYLIALGLVFDTIVLRPLFKKTVIKILTGIVFGILSVAAMLASWELVPGVLIDSRSVILSMGGLFLAAFPH